MCPHCDNSYRLISISKQTQWLLQLQYNSTHSHNKCKSALWHTSDTVGQNILEHNLNSVLPYSKSAISPISTTWHGSPFYFWWWTVWGTEILQDHANRHLAYPPQTDVDRLISINHHLFTSTAHLICRALRSHHFWHNTLAGVRHVVVAATPASPWDAPAITQPQGAAEEFSDTLSLTREQTIPHTGAVNKNEDILFLRC